MLTKIVGGLVFLLNGRKNRRFLCKFVSKLGYKDEPSFIANVLNVWWNDSAIIIEQNNNYWWIITAADSRLSYGDRYVGPLSEQRKDSIIHAEKISIKQMEHRNYE